MEGVRFRSDAFDMQECVFHRSKVQKTAAHTAAQESVFSYLVPSLQSTSNKEIVSVQEAVHNKTIDKVESATTQLSRASRRDDSVFKSVTRHLQSCEELLRVRGRTRKAGQLARDIQEMKWLEAIKCYMAAGEINAFAEDALRAFYMHLLSKEQFSTATFCWALLVEFPYSPIYLQPLFDQDGNVNPVAQEAFLQGLIPMDRNTDPELTFMQMLMEGMTSHQYKKPFKPGVIAESDASQIMALFFEKMRQAPASEQFFFYIDFVREESPLKQDQPPTMREILEDCVGLGVFDQFFLDNARFQMIPSFSMIQALVDSYAGDSSVTLCPILGPSTLEDLSRNAQENSRNVGLPFPGMPFLRTVNGVATSDFFHCLRKDLYYGLTVSQVPEKCRQEVARIATQIYAIQQRLEKDAGVFSRLFIKTFHAAVLEMDFPSFRPLTRFQTKVGAQTDDLTDSELFLMELSMQASWRTKERLLSVLRARVPAEKRGGHLQEYRGMNNAFIMFCSHTSFFKELAESMCQDGFFERFQLDTSQERVLMLLERAVGFSGFFPMSENANLVARLFKSYEDLKVSKCFVHLLSDKI